MESSHTKRTVLVPIFGDDVSDETVTAVRSFLSRAGAQLVLVHVTSPEGAAAAVAPRPGTTIAPRWRRLASVAPNRTFVEAVIGDPATEILAEAERFDPDVIVLGPPASVGPDDAWIDEAIARLLGAAPRAVYVAGTAEHAAPRNREGAQGVLPQEVTCSASPSLARSPRLLASPQPPRAFPPARRRSLAWRKRSVRRRRP